MDTPARLRLYQYVYDPAYCIPIEIDSAPFPAFRDDVVNLERGRSEAGHSTD